MFFLVTCSTRILSTVSCVLSHDAKVTDEADRSAQKRACDSSQHLGLVDNDHGFSVSHMPGQRMYLRCASTFGFSFTDIPVRLVGEGIYRVRHIKCYRAIALKLLIISKNVSDKSFSVREGRHTAPPYLFIGGGAEATSRSTPLF